MGEEGSDDACAGVAELPLCGAIWPVRVILIASVYAVFLRVLVGVLWILTQPSVETG